MRPRLIALIYVLPIVGGAAIVWAGVRLATTNVSLGLLLIAMGVVTVVLLVRVLLRGLSAQDGTTPAGTTENGDVTGPYFDYLMWITLGVPMLAILAFVILAITGAWPATDRTTPCSRLVRCSPGERWSRCGRRIPETPSVERVLPTSDRCQMFAPRTYGANALTNARSTGI